MKIILVAMLALLVSGCVLAYGVKRSAPIPAEPATECVDEVLRETPGIAVVTHEQWQGPRRLLGMQARAIIQEFEYSGPNHVNGILRFGQGNLGGIEFAQMIIASNHAPPAEQVAATRPVMRRLETVLEARCGIPGLATHISEWCKGVECPPLQ